MSRNPKERGAGTVDKTDTYAFGTVLQETLANCMPLPRTLGAWLRNSAWALAPCKSAAWYEATLCHPAVAPKWPEALARLVVASRGLAQRRRPTAAMLVRALEAEGAGAPNAGSTWAGDGARRATSRRSRLPGEVATQSRSL